jgi:toxin ParE1/3/4
MARPAPWLVRLTAAAAADIDAIVAWTAEHMGEAQARTYARTLVAALRDLKEGPALSGATERHEIAKGLFSLHVRRRGRKGRHVVLFRLGTDAERLCIDVLRILHDAMDLQRHVPDAD